MQKSVQKSANNITQRKHTNVFTAEIFLKLVSADIEIFMFTSNGKVTHLTDFNFKSKINAFLQIKTKFSIYALNSEYTFSQWGD